MKLKIFFFLIFGILMLSFLSAASWTLGLNEGLTAYYNFNETSGDLIELNSGKYNGTLSGTIARGITGKIGNAYDFDGISGNVIIPSNLLPIGTSNFTISLWMYHDGTGFQVSFGNGISNNFNALNSPGGTENWFYFGDTNVHTSTGAGAGAWYHMVYVRNGTTGGNFYINNFTKGEAGSSANILNGTFYIGSNGGDYFNGKIDELAIWNRVLTQSEISDLYNGGDGLTYTSTFTPYLLASQNKPENNSEIISSSNYFSANYSSFLSTIDNATLYVYYKTGVLLGSNFSVVNSALNSSNLSISNIGYGDNYYWNYKACGLNSSSDSICTYTSNRTISRKLFTTNNLIYNTSVLETTRQEFTINITGDSSVNAASSIFVYNGTSYSSSVTDGYSGIYVARNNIDIPLQEISGNKTFYWEWSFILTNGSTLKQNSTFYSHEVNRTWFVLCNSTYNSTYINFTSKKAENPFPIMNSTFKSAWQYWIGNGNTKRNYSFEDITENYSNWSFCASPSTLNFSVTASIESEATGYAQNYYYIINASLSDSEEHIDLFLLNDSLATVTELKTVDSSQNPISNVIIQIQLYDVGTDNYYTVAMAKTSSSGSDIAYLNWYSSLYKFILIKDGVVVKIEEPQKISATPKIFTISNVITYSFEKFRDFVYTLVYNNATKNFVLTFIKPSGLVDSGCLRVTKRTAYNDTEICLTCETSTSATVYCNVNGYGNGTYIATFYATGSYYLLDWIEENIGETFSETIYNLLGNDDATAYAFLFSGIVTAMFFITPILAIIGLILGILGGAALGFTILNYGEFIGIVIAGGVIAWFVKR